MSNPPPGSAFYPLSNPKGVEYKCEVCGKPAFLQCSICHVTYYCGTEHQRIDWVGIHEKICASLLHIRKPVPFIASEEERRKMKDKMQEKNIDMVSITQLVGQKLLFQGRPEEAVPAALQCLKFTADAYGLASIELVSPYLILAEACIGLNRLCQAEAYLAQAQWTMLKTQHECSNAVRSQLHRKLGLLYAAKGDYDAALENLAKDIFYASCEYGPDHIRTAGGYYQMAEVFYAMNERDLRECKDAVASAKDTTLPAVLFGPSASPDQSSGCGKKGTSGLRNPGHCNFLTSCRDLGFGRTDEIEMPMDKLLVADSLYSRVINIWSGHLAGIVRGLLHRPDIPEGIGAVVAEITQENTETLDDAQKAEAEKMLLAALNYRARRVVDVDADPVAPSLGKPNPKVRLHLALAMLNYTLDNRQQASQYLAQAKVAIDFAAPHHLLTEEMSLLAKALENEVPLNCA